MQEKPDALVIGACLGDAVVDAFDEMLRRRQRLAEAQLAGSLVEHRRIGERAADIGGQSQLLGHELSLVWKSRMSVVMRSRSVA
jgi:hypothetical protein